MASDTITQIDRFTSDGGNKTLVIPAGVDKIVIENRTQEAATNNGYGFGYTWVKGDGSDATMYYHPAADHTVAVDVITEAIEIIDTSNMTLGAEVAITGGTNVAQPVYTVASTASLKDNYIVKLMKSDQTNLNSLDFSIDVIDGTTFKPAAALATAPGVVAGASGKYRLVAKSTDAYNLFAPSVRYITNITQAASAVITTSVNHAYIAGQKVTVKIPSLFGMVELDGLTGVVTAVTTTTFTIDVDSTGFSAFTFPTYDLTAFDYACVNAYTDGKTADSPLSPAKIYNQGFVGVILPGGTALPGGNNDDEIVVTSYKVAAIVE